MYEKRGLKILKKDSLPDIIYGQFEGYPQGSKLTTSELRAHIDAYWDHGVPSPQQMTNALASLVKRGYLERDGRNYLIKGERSSDLSASVLSSNRAESFGRTLSAMIVDSFPVKKDKTIPAYSYDTQGICIEKYSPGQSGLHFMVINERPRFLILPTYSDGPEGIIKAAFDALQPRYATGCDVYPIASMIYFKECTKINEHYRKIFKHFTSKKMIIDMGEGRLALSLRLDWLYYSDESTKEWFNSQLERLKQSSKD
ncbi:hypothetical protein [Neptunomonas sp. XY-337]|uniref:hypothetical protein n=1 Tax=Neptunomonas sp. XY-337 TaxID=2561897 RepID=UPI00145B7EFE|nr:hypothetical protein [Neptunomonas sp. XY-337]